MPAFDIKALLPTITLVFDARNRCSAARVSLAPGAPLPPGLVTFLCAESSTEGESAVAFPIPFLFESETPHYWTQALSKKRLSHPLHLLLPVECFAEPEALAELDDPALLLMARGRPDDGSMVQSFGIDVGQGLDGHEVALLRKLKGPHLAFGVNSHASHLQCLRAGFHWFEGTWLLLPEAEHESRTITSRSTLLKLLGLVVGDADTHQIEVLFKQDQNLSYQLLKLVNSVGFSLRQKISSFSHAITILGHRQLQRWLQLLLFAGHYADGSTSALLCFVARRAALMEALTQARGGKHEDMDRAFMVGLFSMLDVLLHAPIADLVTPLNLEDDIAAALMSHEGDLGRLLDLAIAAEATPGDALAQRLAELAITPDVFVRAQLDAVAWAVQVCREL